MPEMLFELGTEELPAVAVRPAYEQLEREVLHGLGSAGVEFGEVASMGTPRRLIVQVQNVSAMQPDRVVEQRGPSVSAAFDDSGTPTRALEGFCKGQGVAADQVQERDGYVWVTKNVPGRPTIDILQEVLPSAVRALAFAKTMRWAGTKMRFARPIRWVLAAFGGECVQFDLEGVRSGLLSRGHRFNSTGEFEACTLDELVAGLRERDVEPDPDAREEAIRSGANEVSGGRVELTDDLVEENVFLTESPVALKGVFPKEYLGLPEPVLVTAMAKHERFFPVRDSNGKLANEFVSIRNGGDESVVRSGNQWVLNARFNDAKFFFDEDLRMTLDQFLQATARMTFADGLGTVLDRSSRLESLCGAIATATGADEGERDQAMTAGKYAKADLSAGLVSELPSLQGVIGGVYAEREGMPGPVCAAIATQYDLDANPLPDSAEARTGIRLTMADQIDRLAGFLGTDRSPTGSRDPFALRRAAALLTDAALRWSQPFHGYISLFDHAVGLYEAQGIALDRGKAFSHLAELFESRYEVAFPDVRSDILSAAMMDRSPDDLFSPRRVGLRIEALQRLTHDDAFVQTATRPINIVAAAVESGEDIADGLPKEAALDSADGAALLALIQDVAVKAGKAEESEAVEDLCDALQTLANPINAFFESTMVMADDDAVRLARLQLSKAVGDTLRLAGDFTKVVIDG
ncbi:MAG: glycine--tRNA ligase subunit beta [Armatimonadetes bacterium]|nr:glycine--tRNA ligase subunit beta [Armatimonadota bacterium]